MEVSCGSKEVEIDDLAVSFFYVFSRFEYALKRSGHFVRNNRSAKADWNKFGKELDEKYPLSDASVSLKEASGYIFGNPPKKQVIQGNELGWEDCSENKKNYQGLFPLVKMVRNNLFHGGKFPSRPIGGSDRDELLLKHCLTTLNECCNLNADIKHAFHEDV